MKKTKYLTLFLLVFIFGLSGLLAQTAGKTGPSNSYRDADLFDLKGKASEKLEGRIFRFTALTEKFEGDQKVPTTYQKYINENLPPDRSRSLFEEKTGDDIKRKEYIDIGRERFVRENGGQWKIFEPTGGGSGRGSGRGDGKSEVKVEYTEEKNFAAGEVVHGQKVDRYEKILRYTFTYPDRVEKQTEIEAYWFNAEGLLVKKLNESRDETGKLTYRRTELYEYEVKLKIERPAVKTMGN